MQGNTSILRLSQYMDFAGALCSKQQVCILTFWLIPVNGVGRDSWSRIESEWVGHLAFGIGVDDPCARPAPADATPERSPS